MATWRSNTYDGRYMELSISESVDVVNNKSTLYWTLTSAGGATSYYAIGETTVTINGTQVYHKAFTQWDAKVFPAAKGSTSGSITVPHNSDGTKSITVSFKTRVYIWEALEYGGTMTLTSIDRTAPTVTGSVSNITANSFKISASSSVTASKWWYSLNGGSSWTEFGSEGTYKEITVTGLTPNTTYSVQVCARKKSNAVDGYSSKGSYKTLGGTVISTVTSAIVADDAAVKIKLRLTVYDSSFYHKLSIMKGGTTVLTTAAFKLSKSGSVDWTQTLTDAERTALLNAMSSVKSFTGVLSLKTYKESSCTNQIGNASTANATIKTTESVSKPTFTDFSYYDDRELVMGITGSQSDRTIMVQTYSKLVVEASAGAAKNGATVKSYSAAIGNVAKTSSGKMISVGALDVSGDSVALTVSCIDSRGYSTSVTKRIKVLKYERPKLNSVTVRRKDEIEDIIQLSFRGSFSSLKPDGSTEINGLKFAGFYYRKTDETAWSEWYSVKNNVATTGTSFSFSTDQLMLSATEPLSLDTEASYDFWLLVRDQLDYYTSYDDYSVIPQGKPLVSLRKRNGSYDFARVGINNPHPEEALDVAGNVTMNGIRVLGYVGKVSGYFSSYKRGGIYLYDAATASSDAPSTSPGILEVLSDSNYVVQRFTALATGCAVYVRAYIPSGSSGSWTAWSEK